MNHCEINPREQSFLQAYNNLKKKMNAVLITIAQIDNDSVGYYEGAIRSRSELKAVFHSLMRDSNQLYDWYKSGEDDHS